MATESSIKQSDKPPLENGYRQAIATSISVVLGFSFVFLKFIAFEPESGEWTLIGLVVAVLSIMAVSTQLYALWRALQPEDNDLNVYRVTVNYFAFGISLLIASMVISLFNVISSART